MMASRMSMRRHRQIRSRFLLTGLIIVLMLGIVTVDRYFTARQAEAMRQETIQQATQKLDTPINGTVKATSTEIKYLNSDQTTVQRFGSLKFTVVADVTTRSFRGVRYRLLRTRVINTSSQAVDARQAYMRFSGESYSRQLALARRVQRLAAISPAFANEYQPVTNNIDNWSQLSHLPAHSETDVITIKLR